MSRIHCGGFHTDNTERTAPASICIHHALVSGRPVNKISDRSPLQWASALIYARAFTGGEKPSVDSCRYASHANTSFSRALCSHRSHLHLSCDDFISATGSDFFTHSRIYCCLFSCPVKWSLYNATTRRRSQRHASQRSAEASITPLFLLYGQKELQQPLG